jgi:FtsH-binding integral membrane protein
MADFDNRVLRGTADAAGVMDAGLRAYMIRIYNYMLSGLVLTGLAATAVMTVPALQQLLFAVNPVTGRIVLSMVGWIVLFAPLAMVFFLSWRISKMSVGAAQATFWIYAGVNGLALSPILLIYTGASIAQAFFVTAATFGAMSLYGYTTKRDLTGWGSFLFMGLIGLLIAMVVGAFLQSSALQFVISVMGVLIFTGLTAYDTQKIKEIYYVGDDGTIAGRKAIIGALSLYLDFINIFLFLLRLFGDRR